MKFSPYHHGTFVDPSKDLFTIVDLSRVWVLGEVYETDLPFIRTGQAAEIELPYSGGGRKLRGRVEFIYPFLDSKSRTAQVRMEFPNPGLSLKPEMFTNISMSVSVGRQVLVPQDAVMDMDEKPSELSTVRPRWSTFGSVRNNATAWRKRSTAWTPEQQGGGVAKIPKTFWAETARRARA